MSKLNFVDSDDVAGFGAIAEQDYQHLTRVAIVSQRLLDRVHVMPPLIRHKSLWTADEVKRGNLMIRPADKF
jgi:hypothetical protein